MIVGKSSNFDMHNTRVGDVWSPGMARTRTLEEAKCFLFFFLADFGGVTLAPFTLVISWRFGIVLCVMLTSNLLEFLNCSCCVISSV